MSAQDERSSKKDNGKLGLAPVYKDQGDISGQKCV